MDVHVNLHLMLYCSPILFWILKENKLNSVGDTVGINVYSDIQMVPAD